MKTITHEFSKEEKNDQQFLQLAHLEKMAELGKIVMGVVHELNSPISVMVAASQMISREGGVPDPILEYAERITSEGERLSRMLRGLLNFSRKEEKMAEVDISLAVTFILDFLSFEAAKRTVTIHRDLDHHLPLLTTHEDYLKQILMNVLMNALQAMEESEGGTLLVRTFSTNDALLKIRISDTGPGIPEHLLEHIFEPYFTTKKPGEGTGLGLYVTKKLVEKIGGTLTIESNGIKGTRCTISLPL